MNKLITISSLAASIVLAGYALPSLASPDGQHSHKQGHKMGERSGPGKKLNIKRMMHRFAQLELSEQQKIDIRSTLKQGFVQSKPKKEELHKLNQQLRELNRAEQIDEQAIRTAAIEIANLRSDIMIEKRQNRNSVEALLTDEQRQKMQSMKDKRASRQAEE